MSLSAVLLVLFITLKITHVIAWSWLWVLAPLWVGIAAGMGLIMFAAIIGWKVKKLQ